MNIATDPEKMPPKMEVTTGPLPASRKIYVEGTVAPDIRVPMREIDLSPSANEKPVRVYDTSGPYSDPNVKIDIYKGLARIREKWIMDRGDVEAYEGREVKPEDNGNATGKYLAQEFPIKHKPLRSRNGQAVTQLAYARRGIITPEMEYIAIRENMARAQLGAELAENYTPDEYAESFGASIPAQAAV